MNGFYAKLVLRSPQCSASVIITEKKNEAETKNKVSQEAVEEAYQNRMTQLPQEVEGRKHQVLNQLVEWRARKKSDAPSLEEEIERLVFSRLQVDLGISEE